MPNELVLSTTKNHVTTLTMNNPRRLNGWTVDMMLALRDALKAATDDPDTKAVVLTGTDPYYCAGVHLGGVVKPDHPAKLHAMIVEQNRSLFELFINFEKPILVAVNGPAIGASVTSATLCDAIIASPKATFSTPFSKVGLPAEGCSSVTFPRLFGERFAQRMHGPEGYKPTAEEAADVGMVSEVVPHEALMTRAQELAESWVEQGKERSYPDGFSADELREINAHESVQVADAFLSAAFLKAQFQFLWSKGKQGPATMFLVLWLTRPLWAMLLPHS